MGEDKKEEEKNITNMEESEKKNVTNEEVETVAEKETTEKVEEKQEPEVPEIVETQKEESEDEYIPEQLDDDDFEAEKIKAKEEKKAKKLEKKVKKDKAQVEYDENGNPIKKAKSKKTMLKIVLIIVIVLIVVVGIVAYFFLALNNPENVVQDFAIYFNNDDWDNVADCIDMRGFLTLSLIDTEISEADDEGTDTNVSYMDYDSRYETVYEDLETAGYYDETMEIIEYGAENNNEILSTMFDGYTLTIETIKSTEKIENTDSLYEITCICTLDYGDSSSDTYTLYVAKVDGSYKLVGGDLPYLIYTAYVYYQYYYSYTY